MSKATFRPANEYTVVPSEPRNHTQSQMGSTQNAKEILATSHMEILHKNQCLKEPCELPFIHLSEQDEKMIFDTSVQLKFGDFRTVLNTAQSLELLL